MHTAKITDVSKDTILFCQGEEDQGLLAEAGFEAIVLPLACPQVGSKAFNTFYAALNETHQFSIQKYVALALHTNQAGQAVAEELARRIGPAKCWQIRWGKDAVSAATLQQSESMQTVRECVLDAAPWPVRGIVTVEMLTPALDRLYTEGEQPGLFLGWESLARFYRPKEGEVTTITGMPQHGKSFFANHMMIRFAQLYDWRFAVFSPENYPLERYVSFLVSQHTNQPFVGPNRMTQHTLWEAQAFLEDHFSFILPDEDDDTPSLRRILDLARIQVERHGIHGLLIDPWNELDHERPARKTETEYISECLTQIRRFARRYRVHCFIVAHPTKMKKETAGKYEKKFPPPTAYDISGSANWYNKPDNILCVWRDLDEETDVVEIHVQKVRFRGNGGRPGVAQLRFHAATGTYADLETMY